MRTSPRRHVTMKDIAQACNVSISTVSLVLSQDERIPAKTRQKVLAVVKSFGYRPNVLARNLSRQSSMTLACVLPQETFLRDSGFYGEFLAAVYDEASANGYRLIFEMVTPQFVRRRFYLRLFREGAIDGMILVCPSPADAFLSDLEPYKNSVVVAGGRPGGASLFSIGPDSAAGGRLATEHLLKLGHKKIGCLSFAGGSACLEGRSEGWRQALKVSGIKPEESWQVRLSAEGGPSLSAELNLWLRTGVTAVFAVTDLLALRLIGAAQSQGVLVPRDLSVIGMDNLQGSVHSHPPLTSIDAGIREMAAQAVRRLTAKKETAESRHGAAGPAGSSRWDLRQGGAAGKEEARSPVPDEVLKARLVERASCRALV